MESINILREQSDAGSAENKQQSTSENTEFNHQPINGTPIIAREIDGKWFGTIGRYKVTDDYEYRGDLTIDVAMKHLKWEDVGKALAAQHDHFMELIKGLTNEIESLKK